MSVFVSVLAKDLANRLTNMVLLFSKEFDKGKLKVEFRFVIQFQKCPTELNSNKTQQLDTLRQFIDCNFEETPFSQPIY